MKPLKPTLWNFASTFVPVLLAGYTGHTVQKQWGDPLVVFAGLAFMLLMLLTGGAMFWLSLDDYLFRIEQWRRRQDTTSDWPHESETSR